MKKTKAISPQSRKFIEAAHDLECDEDEAAFDAKIKTVASQKPKPKKDEAPNE